MEKDKASRRTDKVSWTMQGVMQGRKDSLYHCQENTKRNDDMARVGERSKAIQESSTQLSPDAAVHGKKII